MKLVKIMKKSVFYSLLSILTVWLFACSSFNYKTYDEKSNENIEDPDPNYELTLDENFQDFTSFMFIGNRIENFSTYFNTYFNAKENFDDAYDDYATKVLATYNERQGSIFTKPVLSQEAIDKFNKAIEKASKVIQYHKSSQFMDRSVLLIGKSYYYLGDYLKAERKFSEFISKLSKSQLIDEALLYLARTQLRLDNEKPALERLNTLIKTSASKQVVSESYQSIAEYYLYKKDYDNAIKNFKKAIELSNDSEFKAQMQFLVASVTALSKPKDAANEYDKVLDYSTSYDLEYLSRFNYAKNLVLSNEFSNSKSTIEDLVVKYKDNVEYVGQVSFLEGTYYEQKKDYKTAIEKYYNVITTYPKTIPAADASYRIGVYYENNLKDYLNAYRYYRFANEQSTSGSNYGASTSKINTFKNYFDLRSIIVGYPINTDYDNEFKKKTNQQQEEPGKDPFDEGGKGGEPGNSSLQGGLNQFSNIIYNDSVFVDSVLIKAEAVANAKYELAELFLYNLNKPDSCEYYLHQAFDESGNSDFKARVLFALSSLYRNSGNEAKSDEILRRIIDEFPNAPVANSSRRLLNIYVEESVIKDGSDSLFIECENKFVNRDYEASLRGFQSLLTTYPSSTHISKALYASGWIYENILLKNDSAYYYYSALIKSSPNSEAASMVQEKILEYESVNSLQGKDSSGVKQDSLSVKDTNNSNSMDPQQLQKEFENNPENIKKEQENPSSTDPLNGEMKKEEEIEVPKNEDGK